MTEEYGWYCPKCKAYNETSIAAVMVFCPICWHGVCLNSNGEIIYGGEIENESML